MSCTHNVTFIYIYFFSNSDNDFCDFTPPSKKIKETNKKKKSKRDHESKETIVSNDSPKDKSPKQRLSLEERKFQVLY